MGRQVRPLGLGGKATTASRQGGQPGNRPRVPASLPFLPWAGSLPFKAVSTSHERQTPRPCESHLPLLQRRLETNTQLRETEASPLPPGQQSFRLEQPGSGAALAKPCWTQVFASLPDGAGTTAPSHPGPGAAPSPPRQGPSFQNQQRSSTMTHSATPKAQTPRSPASEAGPVWRKHQNTHSDIRPFGSQLSVLKSRTPNL